jgi:hypothetical protein
MYLRTHCTCVHARTALYGITYTTTLYLKVKYTPMYISTMYELKYTPPPLSLDVEAVVPMLDGLQQLGP